MKKSILASLIVPALVVGCGSGSSGSSAPTYKWQVVQLKSVSESSLNSKCIIYADSELNDGEVITAYVAEDDYNILYHNADGTIAETFSGDDITNGLFTITSTDVPDDGYVTLEEIESLTGGDRGSYMFSVQKDLLEDMVLNITQEQGSTCYTGSDYRETASDTALVNVQQPDSDPDYYQSSYDVDSVNGKATATAIPVDSPYPASRDVLITAFASYDSSSTQYAELSEWAFISSTNLYEDSNDSASTLTASLSSSGLTNVYWTTIDEVELDSDSGIIAVHDDQSYFWQPIYDDIDQLNVAYDTSEVDVWSGYFSGTISDNDWLFTSFTELDEDTFLDLDAFPSVDVIDGVSVSSVCDVADAFCIDTNGSYSSDEFDYQRVHFRLDEDSSSSSSNITYQSIYSLANDEPVILVSSLFDFTDPTLSRVEINLVTSSADSGDAIQYLMTTNVDLVDLGEYSASDFVDDAAATEFYSDLNGLITTTSETEELYQAMLESNTTTLSNAYDF
ncbi:hypothetical protein [Psychromonas sp. GE-S-Ul-11]|uniref:hypothetical protein n=1 Tax=Psychromonas sp. GE-S-Ul-11 TaxID=3241170 RepID=UPI00390C9405